MRNPFETQVHTEMLIEDAHKKARDLIARDEIDISTFSDIYGEQRVGKDKARVEELEMNMDEKATAEVRLLKRLAEVLEAIIHEQGELANWFGENAYTIKTSRFDDIVNGVDEVVEFKEDYASSFLALGIDVTYSKDLDAKLRRIKNGILRGKLATVNYFEDQQNNIRGELRHIPHVVIGVDSKRVLELAEAWIEGRSKFFAEHEVQFQILEEIKMQCDVFSEFARRQGKDGIAEKYAHTSKIITEILEEKAKKLKDLGRRDEVFHNLMAGLQDFKS